MSPIPPPLLLADLFDHLRLQLPDPIVNWLTPVWILCVGATAGLIITALLWGVLWLISRIPGVAPLADRPANRRVAIAALTILIFLGFAALYLRADKSKAIDAADTAAAAAAKAAAQPAAAAAAPQPIDRAGALGGCLIAAWLLATAIVILAQPKALVETNIALREGVLWPLFITALVMAGCSLFGLFIVRKPMDLLASLRRSPELAVKPVETFDRPLEAPPNAFDEPAEH